MTNLCFRPARPEDLPRIQDVYRAIIQKMDRENIPIWDDVYPCETFPSDIAHQRLYLREEGGELLAAFALSPAHDGEELLGWAEPDGRALYLDRLGVNIAHLNRGLGREAIRQAAELAREKGARWLRLYVVDFNIPAIRLYEKCGFRRVSGIYDLHLGDLLLQEYGFELDLSRKENTYG